MFDTTPSSVTIRGVRGGASRAEPFGDIAIDDVQVCQCVDVGVRLFACVRVDLSFWGQRDDILRSFLMLNTLTLYGCDHLYSCDMC